MNTITPDHDSMCGTEPAPLLTTTDLERILRVNKRTIARLCRNGTLPQPMKIGQGNRWRSATITAIIESLEHQQMEAFEKA